MLPSVVPLYMERVTAEVAVSHKVLGIAKLLSYQLRFEPANRIPICGHPSLTQERKIVEVSDIELLRAKKFRVVRRTEKRDAGMLTQEVILHPGAVAIVALVDADHLCLIRNRRTAVGETLIELPAGTLEEGEDPEATAYRELYEETGYQAEEMIPLSECYMSPGILQERMHFFVARRLTPGEPDLQDDEQIETTIIPCEQAIAMATDGRIHDAKSIVGLLLYAHRESAGG